MLTKDPREWLAAFRSAPTHAPKTMRQALLVGPEGFQISTESASDNVYMREGLSVDLEKAQQQHQAVAEKIRSLGVPVKVFPGVSGQDDGMFPNNVFGVADQQLIVGHMYHPVRQQEASRADIRDFFAAELGYGLKDLSHEPGVCELTGSLIIDHQRRAGVCGLGLRCDEQGAANMHAAFALHTTLATPLRTDEYHTNVVLSLLAGRACVIYPDAFAAADAAEAIIEAYGDAAVVLDASEKNAFAANCLAITPEDVLMSAKALSTLSSKAKNHLEKLGFRLHDTEIDELEKGGGSLRCLIAEVF